MSLKPWEQLSEETLVHYKVFHVKKIRRRSPRNGLDIGLFVLDTVDWANVVAFTAADELILVRQYRHGTREITLEIPGGILHGADEDPAGAARRELREETGYVPGELLQIGRAAPNPAFLTNHITTFLATGCTREGDPIPDEGEDLEVVLVPRAEVPAMVRAGEIDHALVLAGLYYDELRRQRDS